MMPQACNPGSPEYCYTKCHYRGINDLIDYHQQKLILVSSVILMETITRKSLLYKSGLGFYAINHVLGCHHGCRYPCYAYMMAEHHGRVKSYDEWCTPRLVINAYELLRRELHRARNKPDCIHLCLSTDPFMTGYPEVTDMSLRLIELINSHGIECSVLTKGMLPIDLIDRDRFPANNRHGISLVSLNEEFRRKWEPNSATYADRIAALRVLHLNGCETYVHIEPYPTPVVIKQNLDDLLKTVDFVDHLYFGGWNYNPQAGDVRHFQQFYRDQAMLVVRFCSERNIRYDLGVNV